MSTNRVFKYIIMVMALFILLFTGCSENEPTGVVVLNLSDSPIDAVNVDGVYITINSIEYHLNGNWETAEGFTGPAIYNLIDLTNGVTAILGNLTLPGGHYSEIRFMLDIQETGGDTPSNPGCYISFSDETPDQPLFIPSGGESGFKATGAFDVPVNGTVDITADFDIRKGVVIATSHYILQPTIRLIVTDEAGSIQGGVVNAEGYSDIIIFAYEDGTYTDTEDDDPAEMEVRFPNAVVSAKVYDDEGLHYKLCFLAAGTYDLVVAEYSGDQFNAVLGFVPDITVASNEVTTQTIDIAALSGSL